jgi:type IV secretion system protein VirB1
MSINLRRPAFCKYYNCAGTKKNRPWVFTDVDQAGNSLAKALSPFRLGLKSRSVLLAVTLPLLGSIPSVALAGTLSLTEFTALAQRCAPLVPAGTLAAVAQTESGLDPLALHDNTTNQSEKPENLKLAFTQAEEWLRRGDSVDIGLMQINAANLPALGMTAAAALDPCAALAGGAAVLRAAYGGGATPADQQTALLAALSRYNTGTPFKGIMNGYARTVLQNSSIPILSNTMSQPPTPDSIDPNFPPLWNVSATGAYVQAHGASWLIKLSPLVGTQGSFVTMGAR